MVSLCNLSVDHFLLYGIFLRYPQRKTYLLAGGRANNFSYATLLVMNCTLYNFEDWTFSCWKPRNFRRGGWQGYIYRSTGMNSLFLKKLYISHGKNRAKNAQDNNVISLPNTLFYFKNFNRFLQSQKWHEKNAFVKQFIAKFSHFSKSPFVFVTSTRKFQGAQPVRWRAASMWRECQWLSCSGPTPYPAVQGSPLQTEQCHHPILSANITVTTSHNDTGDKFTAGVTDTGHQRLNCEYLRKFAEKNEMILMRL